MLCPHCQKPIHEHETYLMAQRIGKDEPLPPRMRLLGIIGMVVISALILGFLIHLARIHGIPV